MRISRSSQDRSAITGRRFSRSIVISAFGLLPVLFFCNGSGPVSSVQEEQSIFTAADTFDIRTLANAVYPGKIRDIAIHYIHRMLKKGSTTSLVAPHNMVSVYFEPEWIQPGVKRYCNVTLSNSTWPESDAYQTDSSKITRNNWITSKNCLSSYDKTVLTLDSCTIEVTLSGADVDTVEHLLNEISAGRFEYDTVHSYNQNLRVNEITSISRNPENGTSTVYIICSGFIEFNIRYINGVIFVKSIIKKIPIFTNADHHG